MSTTTIELNAPRTFVLKGGSNTYKLTCRRPTADDYQAYFDAIVNTLKVEGKDQIRTIEYDSAQRLLAERVIVAAEGYKTENDAPLETLENWQKMLPLLHRVKIGELLTSERVDVDAVDGVLHADVEKVSIKAFWPAGETGMAVVSGLQHTLATPSEEQYTRFGRASSRTIILGGDRAGETAYPGVQRLLAQLYDELVVSVDGYTVDGQPLAGSDAAREMDTYHKVAAANAVFNPQQVVFAPAATEATKS